MRPYFCSFALAVGLTCCDNTPPPSRIDFDIHVDSGFELDLRNEVLAGIAEVNALMGLAHANLLVTNDPGAAWVVSPWVSQGEVTGLTLFSPPRGYGIVALVEIDQPALTRRVTMHEVIHLVTHRYDHVAIDGAPSIMLERIDCLGCDDTWHGPDVKYFCDVWGC